jgi:hypothetical protein
MEVDRKTLHRHAPTLRDDEGNEIGFEGMEKIRQPYRRRAVITSWIRNVGLIVSWTALIIAAVAHLVKPSISVFLPISAICVVAAVTLSPLLYPWIGIARGLPPLPLELAKLLADLKSGTAKAEASDTAVLTSQFHSPFAILLSSDIDSDWALVPDHRMRCLKEPISLCFPTKSADQLANKAEAINGKQTHETNRTDGQNGTVETGTALKTSTTRAPKTTWLKEVRWQVVVHKMPLIIKQEGFEGDNAIRVSLARRWARAVLRGKTKNKAGLAAAQKVVIEAIQKRLGDNGMPMRVGLNGTNSAEWIKQLLIGDYHDGRIKDFLTGSPRLSLDSVTSHMNNSAEPTAKKSFDLGQ